MRKLPPMLFVCGSVLAFAALLFSESVVHLQNTLGWDERSSFIAVPFRRFASLPLACTSHYLLSASPIG